MTIIYGILGLGLIIFIHELGHFIAARISGVSVESFSIGMGPVILHKTFGQTDYRISLIPLGGYCGMKGQKDFQIALDEKQNEIAGAPDSFYGVSPIKRIFIAFFGPFFNVLFAIISFAIIAMIGYTFYTTDNRVIMADEIYPEMTSQAHIAGMETGDRIIAINDQEIKYFSDISTTISTKPDENLLITVDRNGEEKTFSITSEMQKSTGAGKIGVVNWVDPIIDSIKPDSPADKAGLQKDDLITKINETTIYNTALIQQLIKEKSSVSIAYIRNGKEYHTILTVPQKNEKEDYVQIGIVFKFLQIKSKTYSFFPAIFQGIKETFNMFKLTIKSLGLLFKGIDLTQAVSGPLRITVMLGDMAKTGFSESFSTGLVSVLNFMALISISLFIMNLLPIPILDGGLILFAIIELFTKRQVSPKIQYYVQFIGLAFIAFLFVFALFGDISYIIKSWRNIF